ncbi:MAG TPA: pilus assembly protein TadG-related protein [Candidatus Limnocylindrales bacterium]|nr:pilus assembly protein TadG-related protein [Candidatus Limnocylindrales bacterium]
MRSPDREQGQVLVIFVGALFVLFAIAALVIDLGFVFMIKRQEQNAADPGAIAAARYIHPTPSDAANVTAMRQAACFYARENGFFANATTNDGCIPANDANASTLTVNYPPSRNAGRFAGSPGAVEVVINRVHNTFFGGLLPLPQIGVASAAVAAFDTGASNSSSLISLDPHDCGSGHIHGTGTINIHPLPGVTTGGFVQVNSDCSNGSGDDVCGPSSGGLKVDANASNFTAPMTYVVGSCQATSGTVNGGLDEGAAFVGDPLAELPPPKLADSPAGRCSPTSPLLRPGDGGCKFNGAGTVNLAPGIYYGGWQIQNNVTLVLAPGLYIMAGGGVKLNAGGSITSVQGGSGGPAPVMFFNTDDPKTGSGQSDIDFTATSTLSLRPIATGPYTNILMWNDGNGSNPAARITLGGQTVLDIAGTIYSPKGLVTLEGGSGVGGSPTNRAAIQIIAWQWDVGGNATLDMPYDPNQLYQIPQKGLVH